MRKIVWSLILIIVVGVIAFFQYKHFTPPSYTEMSLDEALVHYIERFDDNYLSQPEKDALKSLVNDSLFVKPGHGGSRLHVSTPDEYGVYLDASLFDSDNLNPSYATKSLANNPDNFMLIITLVHENQHRKNLVHMDSPLLRGPITDPVATFTLDALLEYHAYKAEFKTWKAWNQRNGFALPGCNIHKQGKWTRADTNELTPEQYGYGMAMYLFWESQLPIAQRHLPDTPNATAVFKSQVKSNVINDLSDSQGEVFYYGDSFLDGILYCPDEGFPGK